MNVLDDMEKIKKTDSHNMLTLLSDFPDQCVDAVRIGKEFSAPAKYKDFKNIIFIGMGGSAIGADLVRSYLYDELRLPVVICRDYDIPGYVGADTLAFVCSYSGNTEETLESYLLAKKKNAKIIAITSGGKLAELCKKDGFPLITIPGGYPPRAALGYAFFAPLLALVSLGLVGNKDSDIQEAIEVLGKLRDSQLSAKIKSADNSAKKIASQVKDKLPIIYSAGKHFDAVAIRWRGQFAENSKALSFTHVFPEMNHNEIVGWENPKEVIKQMIVIMLRDKGEHPRVSKRIEITQGMIEEAGSPVLDVTSHGAGLLARIFSLIYIGDFASFYLAILNKCDPTPVDRVTYLKNELGKV